VGPSRQPAGATPPPHPARAAPPPHPSKPDAELVAEARAGGRESAAELVTRHWDTAVCLAARVLGSAELAHDAAQEATVAVLTNLGQLKSPGKFGAWFCGITLNVARRWLRQLRLESPALTPDLPSDAPGPAELAEAAEIAARVRAAIGSLPAGQRDAVRLFYLQGLSYREIAGELGISVGAVKSRLHLARGALAPRLALIIDHPEERTMPSTQAQEWVDVSVTEVRRSDSEPPGERQHIMVLAERDGGRRLPVWIGPYEATALAFTLESVEAPRPFTYALAASLVEAAGSQVLEVRITRLAGAVFYATVTVAGPDGPREVDARPSDAVNLALVAGAPVRVESGLFDVSVTGDEALNSMPVATAELAAEVQGRMQAIYSRHSITGGGEPAEPTGEAGDQPSA
jgi:RNA polymerase sigma factor (sigma-70 family)